MRVFFVDLCLSLPKTRLSAAQTRQGKEGGRGKKQGKEGGRGKKSAGERSREKKAAGERRGKKILIKWRTSQLQHCTNILPNNKSMGSYCVLTIATL